MRVSYFNIYRYVIVAIITLFILLKVVITVNAQGTYGVSKTISGVVKDSETGEAIPLATIFSEKNPKRSVVADEEGKFTITGILSSLEIWQVTAAGYEPVSLKYDETDTLRIVYLSPRQYELDAVVINPTKGKYSKKNNPAVDFVNKLREESKIHDPKTSPYYGYSQYEKTLIGVNDFKQEFKKGYFSRGGKFLEDYVDISPVTGKRLFNLMLKEKVATHIFQGGDSGKEIVEAYRSCGVDEVFNQDNMRIILEDAVREINPYTENITLLQNRFVSPLSKIGPDFYKYYLTDTVYVGDERCIELTFVPHNAQSMGFNGKIYVPLGDSTMFVKKITMRTPSDINMNLVDNIFINLTYEKDSIGNRHKVYDDVCIELSLIPQAPKIYGRKTTVYKDFDYSRSERYAEFYDKLGDYFALDESSGRSNDFWAEERLVPLTVAEARMGGMMKAMRKKPLIYWGEKVIRLLESGYLMTGKNSKFDIGPLNTLISGNSVGGMRFRLGGMTTANLNKHFFAKTFVAYGMGDRKWKYGVDLAYSFPEKKYHSYEWPRHGFYLKYRYDLDMIGQHYLFTSSDNVFLSIKRMKSNLTTYRRLEEGGYILELPNNFSVEAKFKRETQEATQWIPFKFENGNFLDKYKQASLTLSLRWAPGEKFIQGRTTRSPVNMDAWIFQFTHEFGPKGFLGSAFTLNRSELSMQKRLWFSAFGYMDLILKGGLTWSSVYFPSLMWPNANLSYTIQPESYSLMTPMEFANDKYGAIDFTYFGLGVLFNRIPHLNRLKLREVVTFKGLMGGLSDKNNPEYNSNLPVFPFDAHPRKMKDKPYMELGVGIDNIFMFFRIDYVWRLTYRDTPGCDKSGLRFAFHFSF